MVEAVIMLVLLQQRMLGCLFNQVFITNSYSNFLFEKHDLLHPSPAITVLGELNQFFLDYFWLKLQSDHQMCVYVCLIYVLNQILQ